MFTQASSFPGTLFSTEEGSLFLPKKSMLIPMETPQTLVWTKLSVGKIRLVMCALQRHLV